MGKGLKLYPVLQCLLAIVWITLNISPVLATVWAAAFDTKEAKDLLAGENVTLKCRFKPQQAHSTEQRMHWWTRSCNQKQENVAIGDISFNTNYQLDYRPEQGRYDFTIFDVNYDRDNCLFECQVRVGGSSISLHSQSYQVTVLTIPHKPIISPGAKLIVTEGKLQELTCSSVGGSPDPVIRWYREGSTYPLEAALKNGGSRDQPTVATLSVTPAREDDNAVFRCVVWNRALPEGSKLESTVTLSVNYFPRLSIGPDNPLRIERDSTASLQCNVDAKPKVQSVKWTRNGRFISNLNNYVLHRVSLQDAGKYTCSADNGLGKVSEVEITLDVLYGPIIVLESRTKEVELGEHVLIKCNVSSNPLPISIKWHKEDKPDFCEIGDTLRLNHVQAENSGTYICQATNIISSSSSPEKRTEKVENSSIALLIRHKPGKTVITLENSVVTEGQDVVLECAATPSGWPAPQYRWFKMGSGGHQTVLATGSKYIIRNALIESGGIYNCQATNELGHGQMTSINIEIYQPVQFIKKLKPSEMRQAGETNFSLICSSRGKPKASIKWLKNDREITAGFNLFEVETEKSENLNGVVIMKSTLMFRGSKRTDNMLLPEDDGIYSCIFENKLKNIQSSMHLRIEHKPLILHQYDKVAYDMHESAQIICKVQSYPKPTFDWFFETGTTILKISSGERYKVVTNNINDTYTNILMIAKIQMNDLGQYHCQVSNRLGSIDAKLRLQLKGPPEKPTYLRAERVESNSISLRWTPGFNGGFEDTKYFVSYRKLPNNDSFMVAGCNVASNEQEWSEANCQQRIPCDINNLEQHQNYVFKVKAMNTKGKSKNSEVFTDRTKVGQIPEPNIVIYDPATSQLYISIPATCLGLIAFVESRSSNVSPWSYITTLPLKVSGLSTTDEKTVLKSIRPIRNYKNTKSSLIDDEPIIDDKNTIQLHVKFCWKVQQDNCGKFIDAKLDSVNFGETSVTATPTLTAIIVSCIVFLLLIGLLTFCHCKRRQLKNSAGNESVMDSRVSTLDPRQNQAAPPPYCATSGMEHQSIEHSMDLALSMEDSKNVLYASENRYGYHVGQTTVELHQGQQNMNREWVNMAYLGNSYSNSNNGGSVNSQDSLWQMKMAAATSNSTNEIPQHDMNVDHQNSYGYDPITHGGYGAVDDYAPYPHIITPSNHGHDYIRNSNNPSRQEYCSDPYAAVLKPKKRIEQQMDSPYHDVSGLPDPYLEQMEDEKPPQHMSLSYEESLESGYSTPNSRTRRVIREIIV